jgi:hypothetical protein
MPRTGPRRPNTAVRMSEEQTKAADERAVTEGFVKRDGTANRSEWVRLAEEYARLHMPSGWRP